MNKAALIIVFEYKNSNIKHLPAAKEDLKNTYNICCKKFKIPNDKIFVITDIESNASSIDHFFMSLKKILPFLSKELFVYISCHGKRGRYILFLHNNERVKIKQKTVLKCILTGNLNNIEIKKDDGTIMIKNYGVYLKSVPEKCLLIIDICYAGTILPYIYEDNRMVKLEDDRHTGNIVSLSSSSWNEKSIASTKNGSIFTNYVYMILNKEHVSLSLRDFIKIFNGSKPEILKKISPMFSSNSHDMNIKIPFM